MDFLTLLFRLPLLPLRGFLWLGETLHDEAERELHDPAAVRRELEEADAEVRAGHLSQDELARVQADATARMIGPAATGSRRAAGRRASSRRAGGRRAYYGAGR
ncbi:MAG TPA: gas vesicle protein GvpG [Streptosporangiaceae bacterium]|nr:gas vesicle protein GvpG [Streptosporangiaceae bacterium]